MTDRRPPASDQFLTAWFEDGPTRMPDRVLDVVADRIGRQGQRRPWRLLGRPLMSTYPKFAAAAAVVIVLAVTGYALLPKLGVGPAATPSPAPSPTVYASSAFEVPFTITLPDGWHPQDVQTSNVDIVNDVLAYDVGFESIASSKVMGVDGTPRAWPADLAAWIRAQPEFTILSTDHATVAGRTATLVTVDVRLSATDAPRQVVMAGTQGWRTVRDPERWRFVEVRLSPTAGIAIIMPATPAGAAAASTALDQLLSTLVITAPTQ